MSPLSLFRNNMQRTKKKPTTSLVYDRCSQPLRRFFFRFTEAKIGVAVSYSFTSFKKSSRAEKFFHWSCSGPYFNHVIKYCTTFVLLYLRIRLSTSFFISYDWYVGVSLSISTAKKWLGLGRWYESQPKGNGSNWATKRRDIFSMQ